ncbi:MAG: BadM/Rrf2 family transcriptional regulator [Betaproteobacteria bacterium HGW-Betaproteobacteria-10]|nr:MAG: BadM/Rrf2 family transcriptional regulator [Betaproteobacteria bacterium HGW-Betaproteobacteria-10]
MRLTTFTDYTLRVLMYLAIEPRRLATIPEMAAAYDISENHLMKVVHRLARSGTIESVRGKGGGVRLALAAADIRLGQVIRSSEGDATIVECFSAENNNCRITPACRLTKILADTFAGFYQALDSYSLADLVSNPQQLGELLAIKDAALD